MRGKEDNGNFFSSLVDHPGKARKGGMDAAIIEQRLRLECYKKGSDVIKNSKIYRKKTSDSPKEGKAEWAYEVAIPSRVSSRIRSKCIHRLYDTVQTRSTVSKNRG